MIYPPLWSPDVEKRVRSAARNLDDQQRAPGPVQMCTRCVVTNQRPRIVFDAEGVCSACRYHERKYDGSIDWEARGQQLETLLNKHSGAGRYDVIVPASGGKDSSFVAWTLREMGMRPLLARWAPHITSAIGERNWQSLIHSGFDSVTAQPNGLLHRRLSRLALEFYGDPFLPFIFGQLAWPFHAAVQNGVNLVFFGESGEAEYGGDPSANDKPCWNDADWDRVYLKGANLQKLMDIGVDLGAISKEETASPYYTLPVADGYWIERRPEFHWLGYYMRWHPQGNFYHAVDNTGFEPQEHRSQGTYSRYASIDDHLDDYHYFWGWLKFGIGRATSDAAQEVRNDELTRGEALALVSKYDGEFPSNNYGISNEYLGIDDDCFGIIADRFNTSGVDWRAKMVRGNS